MVMIKLLLFLGALFFFFLMHDTFDQCTLGTLPVQSTKAVLESHETIGTPVGWESRCGVHIAWCSHVKELPPSNFLTRIPGARSDFDCWLPSKAAIT